jgi:hypothetical protein
VDRSVAHPIALKVYKRPRKSRAMFAGFSVVLDENGVIERLSQR